MIFPVLIMDKSRMVWLFGVKKWDKYKGEYDPGHNYKKF